MWEPPVNVFEDEFEVVVVVALPGVPAGGSVHVTAESRELVVRAETPIPFAGSRRAVRRLEIPYGHFERRAHTLSTFIPPLKISKRGASKVVVRPDGQVKAAGKATTRHDQPLPVALTRAFYWLQLLDEGVVASGSEIAQREGLHRSAVNGLLRRALLEPAIIQAVLAAKQPRCMSLLWFQRNPLPTDWAAQRQILAWFDA